MRHYNIIGKHIEWIRIESVSGMISGLSTGLYETLRNLLKYDGSSEE